MCVPTLYTNLLPFRAAVHATVRGCPSWAHGVVGDCPSLWSTSGLQGQVQQDPPYGSLSSRESGHCQVLVGERVSILKTTTLFKIS